MLKNMESIDSLRSIAADKSREYITKTVKLSLLEEAQSHGWTIEKKNEKSVRLKKKKAYEIEVVDRVWSLLYKMGFLYMNSKEAAQLIPDSKTSGSQAIAIDVVGIDHEVGVEIQCKASSERRDADIQFRQELDQYILARQHFAMAINQQFAKAFDRPAKRKPALAVFACNINISEEDKRHARENSIALFDEDDLGYYEDLLSHLGAAAKYQFLADLLPGKEVPGLNIRVPAIRTKMGDYTCYSFVISAEHLLKISYISHHARGKNADLRSYQRMLEKKRLENIREYIDKKGIFPTNIVINLDKKPTFHKSQQETEYESGVFGWLDIKSAYKSAWVIDGQHRLYAYSGHLQAARSRLSVLAFEALPASVQAQLFVDINAQQKSVKQSLLQELYGELHKDASDPEFKVRSLISQAIQALDADRESAFYQRIQNSEEKKDTTRCISWNSLFRVLDSELTLSKKKGETIYGPLWVKDDDNATKERIVCLLKRWFDIIRETVPEWWDAGSGEGGGLAMNDSIVACINVLRSVFQHLSARGENLYILSSQELSELIKPYALAVSRYLGSLSKEERQMFRLHNRGNQGQTQTTKMLQIAINKEFPEFVPRGLKEQIQEQTNGKVRSLLANINKILKDFIIDELRSEFGPEEQQWWMEGIPNNTQQNVWKKCDEDKGKQGNKEYYFEFSDYKSIIRHNWSLFQDSLGYGSSSNHIEDRIAWITKINDIQDLTAHEKPITLEQLAELETYEEWLYERLRQANGRI